MRAIPTNLKMVRGNPGKRPLNMEEPKPDPGIPEMPDFLEAFPTAIKWWKEESEILFRMGVLTEADKATLAMRCYLAAEIEQLSKDIKDEGHIIKINSFNKKGQLVESAKANPKCSQLKAALTEHRQIGELFGLNPSSRTKLKAQPHKGQSKVDKFKRKKKA